MLVFSVFLQLREVGRKFRSLHDGSKKECEKLKEELKEAKEKTSSLEKEKDDLQKKVDEAPAQSGAPASSEHEDKIKVHTHVVFIKIAGV